MEQIIKLTIVVVLGILISIHYVAILRDYLREKKISYIRKDSFLLMENDGNLLSLTVEKNGFDAHIHYASGSSMLISESGD